MAQSSGNTYWMQYVIGDGDPIIAAENSADASTEEGRAFLHDLFDAAAGDGATVITFTKS